MNTTKNNRGRFKVGDWVAFPYGTRDLIAQVVEDRGPLGVKRRHLYRIRVAGGSGEPDSFEMPEDELSAASLPDKASILKYLEEGGLAEMLRSNLSEGDNLLQVWLTFTPRGEVSHTFIGERGVGEGARVPFFALHEGKVFTGKEDEVVTFLTHLGLDRSEAQEVVATVGKAPEGAA